MLTTNENNLQSQVEDIEDIAMILKAMSQENRQDIKMYLRGVRDGLEMRQRGA